MGGFGVVLGRCWGGLGHSWAVMGRKGRFWERKGCQKGGILGGQAEPKSLQNRGAILDAKKLPLRSGFGRCRVVFWWCRWVVFVVFPQVLQWFRENRRFGRRWVSEAKIGSKKSQIGTQKGRKMEPKGSQNRSEKAVQFSSRFVGGWCGSG